MLGNTFSKIIFLVLLLIIAMPGAAQRKAKRKTVKKPVAAAKTETPTDEVTDPEKKNSRPEDAQTGNISPEPGKKNLKNDVPAVSGAAKKIDSKSVYFYEFSRPDFSVEKIFIDHDENGKGTIRFMKKYYDEEVSDPIILSESHIKRIKMLWNNLNFLDSTENYQYEKDYSHLGNLKFTMKKDGRERTSEFNWTTNPDAKALADEYRKISNQYIWIFDINVSRENQPLESAKIMNTLDMQIERNEIADPEQMIPFLKELADDERIPLISRNHATRIVKNIEKKLAKKN